MGIRKSETKYRVNITIDRDLWEKLKEYSQENHTTCSAIITQWVLKYAKVKNPQIRKEEEQNSFLSLNL